MIAAMKKTSFLSVKLDTKCYFTEIAMIFTNRCGLKNNFDFPKKILKRLNRYLLAGIITRKNNNASC